MMERLTHVALVPSIVGVRADTMEARITNLTDSSLDPILGEQIVIIQEDDEPSASMGETGVPCCPWSHVAVVPDQGEAPVADVDLDRLGGMVVHDEDLEVLVRLSQDGCHRFVEEVRAAVRRDDYRHEYRSVHP